MCYESLSFARQFSFSCLSKVLFSKESLQINIFLTPSQNTEIVVDSDSIVERTHMSNSDILMNEFFLQCDTFTYDSYQLLHSVEFLIDTVVDQISRQFLG